jgi:hypothetical protein
MGSSSPTVVQAPSESKGTSEVKPYAPVEPYIQGILPALGYEFTATPELYRGSLVAPTSGATQAAYAGYGQAAEQMFPQVTRDLQSIYQNRLSTGLSDPTQDPVYQAQLGVLSQQARDLTGADKLRAQQAAMEAGQYGLGSTALSEQDILSQQRREQTVQQQMAAALSQSEARRIAALSEMPNWAQQYTQAGLTPSSIYEQIGKAQEAQRTAELADQARLAQQEQESRRAQMVTLANLYGGLAGLGGQTQFQQSGYQSQVIPGGPSGLMQGLQAAGTVAGIYGSLKSDIRLKKDIKRVGKLPNGLNVYTWEWTEEAKPLVNKQPTMGVIAQEVQEVLPEAVSTHADGYLMVDYSKVIEDCALRGDN